MATFTYEQNPRFVHYDNCLLDSLTELRFLLTIEKTHAFLRDDIGIYYETESFTYTKLIHDGLRKYTPDFLIRDWQTGRAYLIEIKPKGFADYYVLTKRRKVAEDFIQYFGYDWQYKVVFGNEILLNRQQEEKFESIIHSGSKYPLTKYCFHEPPAFNPFNLTIGGYQRFVKEGLLPACFP